MFVPFVLNFSAPLKAYHNAHSYLIRRSQDPLDHANASLYEDVPTRPCGHFGPFYRPCPVCLKQIPVNEIITLHIHQHIPHYICPPCLNFLLTNDYTNCPVCKNPHLYFRVDAARIPPSTLAQATPPRQPPQSRPSRPQPRRNPRRNIRHLPTEE